ncbi:DUF58 domain-containing protein [Tumebacillus flagellatus]|uniref:VWFA domain-containing protein n=1 Tax=Tumebacillus flagellatus TaxID=1157490 RepID=A0A074LIE9_9BACL|nr:DUF58 domain-containing protein [Tumebacillus flagellatus]KEO81986.1 hypothetical protein EL26_17595 [Tumebacillus flagellatus]
MSSNALLSPTLLARLERLRLQARETPSLRGGSRRTRQLGSSIEFAEYRPYMPGDDLRHLDWRAYARLQRLFLKRFMDERDALLYLCVDISQSMAFGGKLQLARQLAAALGYLALAGEDRVEALLFSKKVTGRTPRLSGKASAYRLFDSLQNVHARETGEKGSLSWLVQGGVPREPGIVVLLSDFLFADGYEDALRRLQAARHAVVVVQILSAEELNPTFAGDLHLIDSETGIGRDVSISPHVVQSYKRAVAEYTATLQDHCRRRGLHYVLLSANDSVEDAVFRRLLPTGVVSG